MEIVIASVLVTSLVWLIFWMIEYRERGRVIDWYEHSYIENGVRYVDLQEPFIANMGVPLSQVTYGKYILKNGTLTPSPKLE